MDTICNSVIHEFDNNKFTLVNIKDRTCIIFKYMINSLVSEEYFKSIDYVQILSVEFLIMTLV